jgi:hypothetical protein
MLIVISNYLIIRRPIGIVSLKRFFTFNRNYNFDIFEMIIYTSESIKELVNKELLILKRFQANFKEIKRPFQWRQKHELNSKLYNLSSNIARKMGRGQTLIKKESSQTKEQ